MGIILAGCCATLLNGFWSGDELAFGVKLAECDLVLADAGRARRLEGTDHQAKVVLFDHDCAPQQGLAAIWGGGENGGETAIAMLGQLGPDDLATILYNSGSTGQAKGAWSDHPGVPQAITNYIAQRVMANTLHAHRGKGRTAPTP